MASKNKTIKEFRHAIAVLKSKGLIRKDIDARKIQPTKALQKSIVKFKRVLTGEAVAVKLSPAEVTKKKALGYKVSAAKGQPRKVIVPVSAGDVVGVSHGKLYTKYKSGLHTVDIEPDVSNTSQLEKWIAKNTKRINAMKSKGEYFGFKLNGYSSTKIYTNSKLLFDDLLAYDIFESYAQKGPKEMRNAIESVQIVSIESRSDWQFGGHLQRVRTPGGQQYKKRKAKFSRSSEAAKQAIRDERAEQARKYRQKLKDKQPAKYEEYKQAAKARAKKSRKK